MNKKMDQFYTDNSNDRPYKKECNHNSEKKAKMTKQKGAITDYDYWTNKIPHKY